MANHSRQGASIIGSMMLLVVIFLFAALTLSEPQQQGPSGFPSYLFLLPMGDLELVAWPMALSALFLALAGGAIAVVILGTVASLSDTWWIAPYLAGNVCMFQAVTWLPLRRPELRVTLSFATVASMVSGPVAFGFGIINPAMAALAYGTIMLVSVAVSVRGVGRARHGLAAVESSEGADYRIPDVPPFRSRVATQKWLEEKRNGLVMKVLTGTFLVLFALVAIFAVPTDPIFTQVGNDRVSIFALGAVCLTLVIPPYFGFGGCCGSERDNIAKDRSLAPFLALRPLTTLQIIEAKVKMATRVAFRLAVPCLGVSLAILLLPTSLDGRYQPTLVSLAHILTVPQALGLMALYALVILGGIKAAISGIWCTLGRIPVWAMIAIGLTPILVVFVGIARLATHTEEIPRFVAFLPKLVFGLAAIKLAVLTLATVRLRQTRLAPDSLIVKWVAGCAIAGIALFAVACWNIPAAAYSRWAIAAQVFFILPLVRVALAPVFVSRGRHG